MTSFRRDVQSSITNETNPKHPGIVPQKTDFFGKTIRENSFERDGGILT